VRRNQHRGSTFIYSVVALVALCGIVSFGVDLGRVQVAKTELQRAADAAARYAATGISRGVTTVQERAAAAAAENAVDGTPVIIDIDSDVEFGTWDSTARTFTVLTGAARSNANATRVSVHRSAARGNAVPLLFARMLGRSTCDVTASAIAMASTGADPYPIVGLEFVESESDAVSRIDSYNSNSGVYTSAGASQNADIASNGDIKLRNGTTVYGDAHPGVGKTFKYNPTVTGSKSQLTKPLNYPNAPTGNISTANNNSVVPSTYLNTSNRDFIIKNSQSYTMPGGTYYFRKFQVLDTAQLTFSGPVKIYVTDRVDVDSKVNTYQSIPKNFKLVSLSTVSDPEDCEIEVEGDGNVYMDIYAPQCEVDIEDDAQFHGYVVGGSLEISESAFVHYDQASGTPTGNAGTGAAVLVK